MTRAEKIEAEIAECISRDDYAKALNILIDYALPVLNETAKETLAAREAQRQDPVDTLTLSNKIVELSILNQRISERVTLMGYINRAAKEWYERIREEHKVRLVQVGEEREIIEKNKEGAESIVRKFVTVAAGVADSMKVGLAHEEFKIQNNCEKMMDRLVYTRKATDKTIDSMRSKLSYEKVNEKNA